MAIHQVVSTTNTEIIKFRKLSCFCGQDFGFCDCFNLTEHNLNQKRKMINREAKTIKRRRLNSSKKNLQAEDSDTDTDLEITYAESDDSMYEIELDTDNIEDSKESMMLVEDKTVDSECRGDGAITQNSDYMNNKDYIKLVKHKKLTDTKNRKAGKKVKLTKTQTYYLRVVRKM